MSMLFPDEGLAAKYPNIDYKMVHEKDKNQKTDGRYSYEGPCKETVELLEQHLAPIMCAVFARSLHDAAVTECTV
eukprot:1551954-Prymnesium_polylepis.1